MKVTTNEGLTFEGSAEEYRKFIALGVELDGGKPEESGKETLQVGDYAEVVQTGHTREGEIVKIVDNEYDEDFPYDTETLDGEISDCHSAEHLRKIPVTMHGGKPYREVEREAEKGELVKVVKTILSGGKYDVGDVLICEEEELSGITARDYFGKMSALYDSEYVVLKPLEPVEEAPKSPFKIGDIVRGKPGQNRYLITNEDMERARVVHIREDGNIDVKIQKHKTRKDDEGETFWCLEPEYFEKVPESCVTAKGGGGTVKITYADGATQTLVNVKSVEVDTEGAR